MIHRPFLDIPALLSVGGCLTLPGSKSISNRVLLLAGLCEGTTRLHGLLDSDDTLVMKNALSALGCTLQTEGSSLHITGLGGRLINHQAQLFLGNAGTAMRPLTAALALLCATQGGEFKLSGVARMHERPIADLVCALQELGCNIDYLGTPGYPPLLLRGGFRNGHACLQTQQPLRVKGDVSSQFLSALLLALPLASQHRPCVIEVVGELISKPYVEMTLKLLKQFGVSVAHENWQRFTIEQGSRYASPGDFHVEGDASSASYFIAMGALAAVDQPLRIEGIAENSIQGDLAFVDAAKHMGAHITSGPNWLEVRRGRWPLKPIDLDCNHIPDAAMTLAVMALYADGPSRLRHIASWRVKETDRIHAMTTELRKLGAQVHASPDSIEVTPAQRWRRAAIDTYDDHRMAMCFSLAAFHPLIRDAAPQPVRIMDPQCVRKTYPDYFQTFFSVARTHTSWIPVITIDGPTASGKGTVGSSVASRLGYHVLDSGVLYRAAALAALRRNMPATDETSLAALAAALPLRFMGEQVWLDNEEITELLRDEAVGAMASKVSALPAVRSALMQLQLSFRQLPGLVADGRDMGTVVFPDAALKIFLTASATHRAERRHKQLILKGNQATMDDLRAELEARDARDTQRSVAPLKPAQDAVLLDNSTLSATETVDAVLHAWQKTNRFAFPGH